MNTTLLDQARLLTVDERIELVEALWDSLADQRALPAPTEAQCAELDRRLAEDEANPDDVVPWSEVKAEVLARIRR
jgi:putative addiction module component (TIGR02574 family)